MDELEEIRKRKMEELKEKVEKNKNKIKIEVNDDDFEEKVIKQSNNILVVVDFWAEWCMPCLMLGPNLEKITEENAGKIILAKVNVDKSPRTSQTYGIMSIPAVKFFKDGKIIDEFVGALPESQIRDCINRNLDK